MGSRYKKTMYKGIQRVVDEEAVSVAEIMQDLLISRATAYGLAAQKERSGEWERVYKLSNGRLISAFRPRTKKKSKR